MRNIVLLLALSGTLACCSVADGAAGPPYGSVDGTNNWDTAFLDRSGDRPLHFVARYVDARGQVHRLEEWRSGQQHLRRKTDDRIDLHADFAVHAEKRASSQPLDYVWNIVDLQKRTVHRVSTAGMLHLGMLYSYYSMAHVLTRPAGTFALQAGRAPTSGEVNASSPLHSFNVANTQQCRWWQVRATGQPDILVCWSLTYGIPLETYAQRRDGWHMDFAVESIDRRPVSPSVFEVATAGYQVRNVDEIESED